jgi:hypothetical protein
MLDYEIKIAVKGNFVFGMSFPQQFPAKSVKAKRSVAFALFVQAHIFF